jgi:hypothetical protein
MRIAKLFLAWLVGIIAGVAVVFLGLALMCFRAVTFGRAPLPLGEKLLFEHVRDTTRSSGRNP